MRDALRDRQWLVLPAGLGLAAVTAFGIRSRRVSRWIRGYKSRVVEEARPPTAEPYDPADVADLPAPVRRYFETVLETGQRPITRATLTQDGQFRFGGAGDEWYPFTASQVYSVSPPGYVWDATIELAPLVTARVLDAYVDGEGLLRANLFGGVPVASAGPTPEMNEAELQRYLSETPWFPTALLPSAGVRWEGIDDRTARATIEDGDVSATGVFHFDEDGHISQLTAERYRQDVDGAASWVGDYRTYEERAGIRIPTEAEVAWETTDGTVPYWRGTITDLDYRTG
jgi:hypothetical protein